MSGAAESWVDVNGLIWWPDTLELDVDVGEVKRSCYGALTSASAAKLLDARHRILLSRIEGHRILRTEVLLEGCPRDVWWEVSLREDFTVVDSPMWWEFVDPFCIPGRPMDACSAEWSGAKEFALELGQVLLAEFICIGVRVLCDAPKAVDSIQQHFVCCR